MDRIASRGTFRWRPPTARSTNRSPPTRSAGAASPRTSHTATQPTKSAGSSGRRRRSRRRRPDQKGRPRSRPRRSSASYEVVGAPTLTFSDGRICETRAFYRLCRCGASKSKPFCDDSHLEVGFRNG
ncbi:MAG TPA: CDGSH iron-sulfur domain-containing protein [Thermoanaerobaculia bacterium]